MKKDLFANKSKSWDMNSKRVKNAQSIAEVIADNISLDRTMHIADIGAGTGLLSFFIAQKVKKITAIDNSESMLEVFKTKQDEFMCECDLMLSDISTIAFKDKYDGFISSMTIHHVQDTKKLLVDLYHALEDGGFIALADLESEDGSFHSDNEGVYHFGFDTQKLADLAKEIGFQDIQIYNAGNIKKPHNNFSIFCLIAYR